MIVPPGYGSGASSTWAALVTAAINGQLGGVFADVTERDVEITDPTEGMLAYLTGVDHLTIYQAGEWRVLVGAGTYTPTLGAGIVIGTGGSVANTAGWSFAGGVLSIDGDIVLGSSGQSIGASAHTISFPAGFTPARSTANRPVGRARLTAAGGGYVGQVVVNNSGTLLVGAEQIVSNYPTLQSLASNVPAVWAAGNRILWSAVIAGVMTS